MFGFKKKGKQTGDKSWTDWHSKSASNPNDPDNFDTESIFNEFKFGRHRPKKEKKVYQKYEPKKDSNFH